MGRIIAIANQKGGVGKTTTTINLSACLALSGRQVLVVDMDPQGNSTSGLGLEKDEQTDTVYEMIIGEIPAEEATRSTEVEGLDIIPANIHLSGAEIELVRIADKEYLLQRAINRVRDRYDFIIIDCPPSLNMLTVNALTAADTVLVPIQCEYYALEGLSQLMYTIELIRERLNTRLTIEGVVFTMYDGRTNLSLQVVENVKDHLDARIYKTIIPRNVRLAEAPSYGLPISLYDPKSTGADSYQLLAEEVIGRDEREKADGRQEAEYEGEGDRGGTRRRKDDRRGHADGYLRDEEIAGGKEKNKKKRKNKGKKKPKEKDKGRDKDKDKYEKEKEKQHGR